jgi:predicted ATPase
MIRTHDQRLRVYISSVPGELTAERQAVRTAIERHRLTPVLVEMAARPYPPRALARAYVAQSDVFIGVYGESYGPVPDGEDSSTIEYELALAADLPRLLYLKRPAPNQEPRLTEFIQRIQDAGDLSYRVFATPQELADLVSDDLAVLLSERFAAGDAHNSGDLDHDAGTPRPLPSPPTSFVGRGAEITALRELITRPETRLVTLIGAGGIGKSRLAVEVARDLDGAFADGIVFVPLAGVTEPELVMAAIAARLGVRTGQDLLTALVEATRDLKILLILDNFEHVIAAATDLGELLARAPGITAVVTSRRLLRLRGEQAFVVAPLAVPVATADAATDLQHAEAVQLFLERAATARSSDLLRSPTELEAVARIVRRLDGVPLAIELAAARTRMLPPSALVDRLDASLDLVGGTIADLPERQRSLRATLDWSYALLAPHVARLFARLSTFVDGWTMEAAEDVCPEATDSVAMLDALSELVDSSMVTVDLDDPDRPRFRLLAPVREYARELLQASGELRDIDARHLAYFRALCDEAAVGLGGCDHQEWLDRLEAENGNLMVLAHRAVAADDVTDVALIAWSVWRWIWVNDHITAARYWMEPILARADDLSADAQAKARWVMGCLLYEQGDYPSALENLQTSRRLFAELGDEYGAAMGTMMLAALVAGQGDADQAYAHWTSSAATLRRHGDLFSAAVAAGSHGVHLLLNNGDGAEADALMAQALADAETIDNAAIIGLTRLYQGMGALLRQDLETATRLLESVVMTSGGRRSVEVLAYGLEGLAGVALARHDAQRAAMFFGAPTAVRGRSGLSPWPHVQPLLDALTLAARQALGEEDFAAAQAAGKAMALSDARRYALETADVTAPAGS